MKYYFPVLVMIGLMCSCSKPKKSSGSGSGGFTYTTACDTVITTYANKNLEFSFNMKVLTGSAAGSAITYSVTGLPTGVTVTPANITVSSLLGGIFDFIIGNAAPGTYPIDLVSTGSAGGTKHQPVKLIILPPADYSTRLAGIYPHSYDFCLPGSTIVSYPSTVYTVSGTPYTVRITNIENTGAGLSVSANVSTVVTIPRQTIGPYTIWGTGTFSHDNPPYDTLYQITVFDTLVNGIDTQHCTMHLQH